MNNWNTNKALVLFLGLLFVAGCSGYIKTTVSTLKADSTIELPVNTFEITQSKSLKTEYPNHFSPYLLTRFIHILGNKLIAKGLKYNNDPDIELRIVEFNLVNRELESTKIEIYSGNNHLETMTYRPLDLSDGVSYFKWTPNIDAACEKIAKKIKRIFNL